MFMSLSNPYSSYILSFSFTMTSIRFRLLVNGNSWMLKSRVIHILSIDEKTSFKCMARLITRDNTESFFYSEISTTSLACTWTILEFLKLRGKFLCRSIVGASSVSDVSQWNARIISFELLLSLPKSSIGSKGITREFDMCFATPGLLL